MGNKKWFSPRELIKSVQTGPNSFRYTSKRISAFTDEEEEEESVYTESDLNYMDSYPSHKPFNKKEEKLKSKGVTYPSWGGKMYSNRKKDKDYDKPVVHYLNKPKENKFAWTPTYWSSYTFGSFYGIDDDDSILIVKDPVTYLTPTSETIQSHVKVYSKDKINFIKEVARVCYFKMVGEKNFLIDKYENLSAGQMNSELYDRIVLFRSIYDTFVPGTTPLEQAINIHRKKEMDLAQLNAKCGGKKRDRTAYVVEFKRENFADAIFNKLADLNSYVKERNLETLNNMSIMGDLGYQFHVEKDSGETEVCNSINRRTKMMRNHEQLVYIDNFQRMLPNFDYKFLTKNLSVNIPVETSVKKQKIIIICDYSGSMNESFKQNWVNTILMDRLAYVIKGEAEVYFSFFVSNPNQLEFHHLKDEESVLEFWKSFSNYPGGSVTDINRIVEDIAFRIKTPGFYNLDVDLSKEMPEILIINDGQDHVGAKIFPHKVNAISLGILSTELKSLCVESGGKQVFISESGVIKTFDSMGEKVIEE